MAHSSIVWEMKDKAIKELLSDEAIFQAINSPYVKSFSQSYKLINKHIFRYLQNPDTLKDAITFITVCTHVKKKSGDRSLFIDPVLDIRIISHISCMNTDNIPGITSSRNDLLSRLIDEKFNGRTSIGIKGDKLELLGTLVLTENTEGALANEYLYRKMLFETRDLNYSLCEG